jgi:polyisoprenoid-binding protein YceI
MKAALVLLLLLPGFAAAGSNASHVWSIDPAQSQVRFVVRKFWFVHVRGTFPALSGSLRRLDTRIGIDLGEVDASLDVDRLHMDDADDRARALGPDFFDASRFPAIRFDSDPFPLDELVSGGRLRGMLNLHGERHPVTLVLQPSNCPRRPLDCPIRVHGAISRSAFGMHGWRGVLSDKVELDLGISLRKPDSSG